MQLAKWHYTPDTAQQEAGTQENSPNAAWFCTWKYWGGERGICSGFQDISQPDWSIHSLTPWSLWISGHFSMSLPYLEQEQHRFSRKIMKTFSITPLPSSTWGSHHTFRTGSTAIIRVTSTGAALGTADKVLQADDLRLLFECPVLADWSQEASCAIAVHSTKSG